MSKKKRRRSKPSDFSGPAQLLKLKNEREKESSVNFDEKPEKAADFVVRRGGHMIVANPADYSIEVFSIVCGFNSRHLHQATH